MDLRLPVIITNFKAYENAIGESGLALAKIHAKVAEETGASIGIAVQKTDIRMISKEVNIPVFSQHADPATFGAQTGHAVPEILYNAGAFGTLINHSEKRVSQNLWEVSIKRAQEAGLYVIACVKDIPEAEEFFRLGADLIAYEPPELIGGDISVSKAKPDVIKQVVDKIGMGKVLVGAGIKNAEDVRTALKLGAVGVLLASGVVKVKNPELVLRDLVSGLKE